MRNKNNEMNNYSKSILNGGMTEENEQINKDSVDEMRKT